MWQTGCVKDRKPSLRFMSCGILTQTLTKAKYFRPLEFLITKAVGRIQNHYDDSSAVRERLLVHQKK